jgi:hypothetical protein
MADELAVRVEDINTVPEKYRDAYREDGGAYFLNGVSSGDFEIANTAALKGALNKERTAKEAALKSLKGFDKYADVDLDAALEAVEKLKEFDAGNIDMEAEVQRKLKAQAEQLIADHSEKLGAANARSEKLLGKLRTLLIDNEAIRAINEAKGNVKNLLPHVRNRVKVVETDDGDFGVQVLTEQGEPAVDGQANPIGIEALVKGFEKEFPFAFKAPASTGGGGGGKDAPGASSGGKLVLTQEQARDPMQYRAARERAAKEGLKLVLEES